MTDFVAVSQYGNNIQNAINSGAKTIILQGQEYTITSPIVMTSNQRLVGYKGATILKTTSNITILQITGSGNKIENVTFEGNQTGASQNGVSIAGDNDFSDEWFNNEITGCDFKNLGGNGFYGTYIVPTYYTGSLITNCNFYGCTTGINFDTRFEYNQVSDCKVYNCTNGIIVKGGNNVFKGCNVTSCTNGFYIAGGVGINDGHGAVVASCLNHNTKNVYSTGVTLGYNINDCMIYAGAIELNNSVGIAFKSCDISVSGISLTGTTTLTEIKNCKFTTVPVYTLNGNAIIYANNTYWGASPE